MPSKIKKPALWLLLLFGFGMQMKTACGQINNTLQDSAEAGIMAENIADSSLIFGLFQVPGNTPIHQLKSGIIPEMQDKYVDMMNRGGLIKLNTIKTDDAFVDSVIFVPMPYFAIEAESPIQFVPYPETQWILFLKSAYDKEGKPRTNWAMSLNKPLTQKYLKPGTLYQLTDNFHGNACLKWNSGFDRQDQVTMASDKLMADLTEIRKTLKSLPYGEANKAARIGRLEAMQKKLQDPFGKIVGAFVKRNKE